MKFQVSSYVHTPVLLQYSCVHNFFFSLVLQRTGMGGNDIYARTGRPIGGGGGGDELDDFSDDETPMTEPIYNGR